MPVYAYPSGLIAFADIPEIQRIRSRFYYNFFEPDEMVSDRYDPRARKITRNSGQGLISRGINSGLRERLSKRVPRYIQVYWRPLKLKKKKSKNSGSESAKQIPNMRIRDNLDNMQHELAVSNGNFTGIILQDDGADGKIAAFLNMTCCLEKHPDHKNTSMQEEAKAVNKRTSGDVSPRFLANALNSQTQGMEFVSQKTRSSVLKNAISPIKDVKIPVQFNNKFISTMVQSAIEDTAGVYCDEMAALEDEAESIQAEALGFARPAELSEDDYDFVIEPVRVRLVDADDFEDGAVIIGYVLDKFELLEDGSMKTHRPIVIENPTSTSYIDTRVKYGATYIYQMRTVAQVELQSVSEETDEVLATTMLLQSKPSKRTVINCVERVPPPPPVDVKGVWDYKVNKLCLMWNFPVNPQRDIKKFQIFRRKTIIEPFELICMLDFDDSVEPMDDREDINPSLREYLKQPELTFYDDDFTMNSKYIYSLVCLDARNYTSNYSMQLEFSFNKTKNILVTKLISTKNAPKAYPNLYLNHDLFVDTIRDSGHTQVKVYFDPEYLAIDDVDGNDLGLLQTKHRGKGGSYQLQFLNVDHQKEKKITIKIKDLRPPDDELRSERRLARLKRRVRRIRSRKRIERKRRRNKKKR